MNIIMKSVIPAMILIVVPILHSQEGPPFPRKGFEKLEQLKKVRLMEEISATEETWVKFFSRYDQYRQEMESIRQKRETLGNELTISLEQEKTEKEYEAAVVGILSTESQLSKVKESFYRDLRTIFTPKQLAQYMAFEMKFYRTIRENLRERMENRPGARRQR